MTRTVRKLVIVVGALAVAATGLWITTPAQTRSELSIEERLARLECHLFGENCPEPTPTPEPIPEAEPCVGTQVPAGANLHVVIGGNSGTFCLEAGAYDLGSTPLKPGSGATLIGNEGSIGPKGEVDAPTKIVGAASVAVIEAGANNTFRWLDISGSNPGQACQPDCGRGIKSGANMLVEYSRVHHNSNNGIGGGIASTVEVRFTELDHNGTDEFKRTYGGIKQAGSNISSNLIVTDSYVHDNTGQGIWGDRCQDRMVAERNLVVDNSRTGIYWETNMDPVGCPNTTTRSALIQHNVSRGNGSDPSDADIKVRNSPNADIGFNSTEGNVTGIRFTTNGKGSMVGNVAHDNDVSDGIAGCDLAEVTCERNS